MHDVARDVFVCPSCHGDVGRAKGGGLTCRRHPDAIETVGRVSDFVAARGAERQHYDAVYQRREGRSGGRIEDLGAIWTHPGWPERKEVLRRVGDLRGKRALLLGNGQSEKELWFLLQEPELLVYSDLSPHGVGRIRASHDLSRFEDRVVFAAIDAHDLPLRDHSMDVVYGYAFVHHLPDVDRFVREVVRVLKPGGRAVFLDDAYSPIWHWSKQTVLSPVMAYAHHSEGISPEDYRFSMTGGFREEDLARIVAAHGGTPWFERTRFLHYFWVRGANALLPPPLRRAAQSRAVTEAVLRLDQAVCRAPGMRRQQIRLVWGFDAPLRAA